MNIDSHIADLLRSGQKLEAIKCLREQLGIGLAEAKAEIERIERQSGIQPVSGIATTPAGPVAVDPDIRLLAQQGRRIDAIKMLRERRRIGLKEAKDALDAAVPPPPSFKWMWIALLIGAAVAGAALFT